jgi:hypothetical protein
MTSKGFNALRRQGVDFKWTAELEKDFIKLKEDFKENNTRSFPICCISLWLQHFIRR